VILILCLCALSSASRVDAQTRPVLLAAAGYPGIVAADLSYDGVGRVYAADAFAGGAAVYTVGAGGIGLTLTAVVPFAQTATQRLSGIAVNQPAGQVFWLVSDSIGPTETLVRTNLAGGARVTIGTLAFPLPPIPNGMDLDPATGNLIVNDVPNATLNTFTTAGVFVSSCTIASGLSTGYASNPTRGFGLVTADLTGGGVTTNLLRVSLAGGACTPVGPRGTTIPGPGLNIISFDYGPVASYGFGANPGLTLFAYDLATQNVFQVGVYSSFVRGDCNTAGAVDLSDLIFMLNAISTGTRPPCTLACDADASGAFGIGDVTFLATFLFLAGPPPPAPFPACGEIAAPPPGMDCILNGSCP
jgi:hypothetical protein